MSLKLPQSPLLLPVCLFTIGAVASFYFPSFSSTWVLSGIGILFLSLLVQFIPISFLNFFKTLFIYCLFIAAGLLYFKSYYSVPSNHFSKINHDTEAFKVIEIIRPIRSNSFSNSYYGWIRSWGSETVEGKILIHQASKGNTKSWQKSQKILTKATLTPIQEPLNPGQFSYKNYLANFRIAYEVKLDTTNCIPLEMEKDPSRITAETIKKVAYSKIESSPLSKTSQAMIKALVFADRDSLEGEVVENYTNAGIIHLLALSGLHVGLFVGILIVILGPLLRFRHGKLLRTLFIFSFLWGFAFLVGFPPSVTRSVTMFSFIVMGRSIHFGNNTFHYTILSFIVLILCYPPYLRSLGFQLSYLAVFGILLLHPLLQRLWSPRWWILKKYWEWTTVCLAAQFAVSPISIYYFHQFPSLFLISNLLILPIFSGFLIFCLSLFVIQMVYTIPSQLALIFDSFVTTLNACVGWIAQQEAFLYKGIYLSLETTLLLYGFLSVLVLWGYKRTYLRLLPMGIVLLTLYFQLTSEFRKNSLVNSLWILHKHQESVVIHHQGLAIKYYTSHWETTQKGIEDFSNSRLHRRVKEHPFNKSDLMESYKMLLVEQEDSLLNEHLNPDYILLREDPKINLDRLLNLYKPKILISDGSNAPWNAEFWLQTCLKKGIIFHDTRSQGALEINL